MPRGGADAVVKKGLLKQVVGLYVREKRGHASATCAAVVAAVAHGRRGLGDSACCTCVGGPTPAAAPAASGTGTGGDSRSGPTRRGPGFIASSSVLVRSGDLGGGWWRMLRLSTPHACSVFRDNVWFYSKMGCFCESANFKMKKRGKASAYSG